MNTIFEIIADCCEEIDAGQITENSRFMDDLGLSSLDFFSLISAIWSASSRKKREHNFFPIQEYIL